VDKKIKKMPSGYKTSKSASARRIKSYRRHRQRNKSSRGSKNQCNRFSKLRLEINYKGKLYASTNRWCSPSCAQLTAVIDQIDMNNGVAGFYSIIENSQGTQIGAITADNSHQSFWITRDLAVQMRRLCERSTYPSITFYVTATKQSVRIHLSGESAREGSYFSKHPKVAIITSIDHVERHGEPRPPRKKSKKSTKSKRKKSKSIRKSKTRKLNKIVRDARRRKSKTIRLSRRIFI